MENSKKTNPIPGGQGTSKETETQLIKSRHVGWKAGTTIKQVNGYDWQISTLKGQKGIRSTAQAGSYEAGNNGFSSFKFVMFVDPCVVLHTSSKRGTEKAIKEAHQIGLLKFDELVESSQLPGKSSPEYEIKAGQLIFFDGPNSRGNNAIYHISRERGTIYHYVNLETLELGETEYLRNIEDKFGIGFYYREGETMEAQELSDIVIEAKTLAEGKRRKENTEKMLIANAKEKRLYRLAQQVVNEGMELQGEFYRSYFNGSSGLMVNVKQDALYTHEDLVILVESSTIPRKYHTAIFEEFNTESLQEVLLDAIECGRNDLYEWLDGCQAVSTQFVQDEVIPQFLKTGRTPAIMLNELLNKKRTRKTQCQAILDFYKSPMQLHEALRYCLEAEQAAFCGTSGGWFLFADSCQDMVDNAQRLIDEFFNGEEKIRLYDGWWTTREEWTDEVEGLESGYEDLQHNLAAIRARAHVGNRLKEMSQDFDLTWEIEERLIDEIEDFLFYDHNYDDSITWDQEEIAQAWIAGANRFPHAGRSTYLRVYCGIIQTSKGVNIPLDTGRELYYQLIGGKCPEHVHGHHIQYWDGERLKVGCHSISIDEIKRFANLMGWTWTENTMH